MQLPLTYPLVLRFQSSRLAAIALVVVHGLAIVALAVSQLAWLVRGMLLLVTVFSLVRALRINAWRSGAKAVAALRLDKDAEIELTYADSDCVSTRLDPSSTVLHWLIVLCLRHEGEKLYLFLLPDMLDADSWRRFSVLLRVAKPPAN